jgi:hypothetical protein
MIESVHPFRALTRMRRALASLLLAVFSFPLIAPAVFADAEPNLPECCRRNGKHHCAMTSDEAASNASAIPQLVQQRCPSYPGALSTPAGGSVAVLKGSGAIFGAAVSNPAIQLQIEAGYRLSFSKSTHKRGPPLVLS